MLVDVAVPLWEPELLCVPVGGGVVVDSVTLDSSDVAEVEDSAVAGGVSEAVDSV